MPTVIPPSHPERILRSLSYLTIGSIGVYSAFRPHGEIPGLGMGAMLGETLTLTWSIMMATALVAAVACVIGRYRIEYAALPWFMTAVILATAFGWIEVWDRPVLYVRVAASTALCFQIGVRYLTLHWLMRRVGKWTSFS
jgi:hypothetical protein